MRIRQGRRFRRGFYCNPRWRSLRGAKLRAAGYRCEGCGRLGQRLEVHHVEPVNEHSDTAALYPGLEGLRALCSRCHRSEHPVPQPVRGRAEWLRSLHHM